MIIELIILQLTLDGIMAQHDQIVQKQQAQRQTALLKLRLAQLLNDYQSGKLSRKEYQKLEADILAASKRTPARGNKKKTASMAH